MGNDDDDETEHEASNRRIRRRRITLLAIYSRFYQSGGTSNADGMVSDNYINFIIVIR